MQTPEQLLAILLELALQQRALLEQESWEGAIAVRAAYDTAFEQLRGQGRSLTLDHRAQLRMLEDLHEINLALAEALMRKAGSALGEIADAAQLLGYSPVGADHIPTPRYLDESA